MNHPVYVYRIFLIKKTDDEVQRFESIDSIK